MTTTTPPENDLMTTTTPPENDLMTTTTPPENDLMTTTTPPESDLMTTTVLSCSGLRATFNGRDVLDDVCLNVLKGEWLGIIGPNGAGKSTLLRSIAGLVPCRGVVTLADGRVPTPSDVALLPQSPILPTGMTVAEYVLLGRTTHLSWLSWESSADRRLTVSVLRRLNLASLSRRRLANLSGGEAQRVVMARALAQQAPTLLLDEPTSALDMGHQVMVLELLDELRHTEGLTVVAAMHDLTAAARFADRLALIHKGSILVDGPPKSVLDERLLSSVYGTPLTVKSFDSQLVVIPEPRGAAGRTRARNSNHGHDKTHKRRSQNP